MAGFEELRDQSEARIVRVTLALDRNIARIQELAAEVRALSRRMESLEGRVERLSRC